jgi:outer membrane protein TolC
VQVDFETLYWDWATAIHERELRAKNVARGKEILKWTRDRYRRSAAESSDVLQAQALLSQRELQLMAVQQNALRLASSAERFLPGFKWAPDPDELARPRDLNSLLSPWVEDFGSAQKLELIEARASAMAAAGRADEARESIRPELELQLGYGKNAIDTDGDTAVRNSFGQSHENSTIALVFKSGLGLGMERRHVESLRAQRDSAKEHLAALEADAVVAWEQQKRDVDDLLAQIERARKLTEVQWRKADAERRRYRVGRSTAFQAITFEQDAAEAEITLWNLYAQMRKTEARARLFAR